MVEIDIAFYIRIFQVFFVFREVCWHCGWGKAKHWVTSITLVLFFFLFFLGGDTFHTRREKFTSTKKIYGENCRYRMHYNTRIDRCDFNVVVDT